MSDGNRQIHEPILIIGSPRSGTTLLGNWIGRHPEVAYWEEPRTIWSQGNAWRPNDKLGAENLTPRTARRIDDRFFHFLTESDRSRFAEKTPSNCLRLPFIHALYPDARIIHLVRDGRAVVASMRRMLAKSPDRGRLAARLKETPWRELPSLAPFLVRDVITPRFRKGGKAFWGPRPPGWQEWLDLPVPVMLARQWRILVETARADLALFPESQRCEIRYEALVAKPNETLALVRDTIGLPQFAEELKPKSDRASAWQNELDPETVRLIEAEAGDCLENLGYSRTAQET